MASPSSVGSRWTVPIVLLVAIALWGCGGDDGAGSDPPVSTTVADTQALVDVNEQSFPNLSDMTPVRGFFVDNLVGDLDATLAVADSTDGGVYPVGTLIQLVPGEAMVKQPEGFSAGTADWEFFELDVSPAGSTIRARGGVQVVNRFGGSCADCHAKAEARFDFVCEQDHGCDDLPIGRSTIEQIQTSDPRPRT